MPDPALSCSWGCGWMGRQRCGCRRWVLRSGAPRASWGPTSSSTSSSPRQQYVQEGFSVTRVSGAALLGSSEPCLALGRHLNHQIRNIRMLLQSLIGSAQIPQLWQSRLCPGWPGGDQTAVFRPHFARVFVQPCCSGGGAVWLLGALWAGVAVPSHCHALPFTAPFISQSLGVHQTADNVVTGICSSHSLLAACTREDEEK